MKLRTGLVCLSIALVGTSAFAENRAEVFEKCKHGQPDEAIGACNVLINSGQETIESLAAIYVNRAKAEHAIKLLDQAVADYSRAISLRPSFTLAYFDRGVIYDDVGRIDDAIADYSRAVELDPAYKEAFNNRGIDFSRTHTNDKAIEDFTRALAIDPNYVDALFNRGSVYYDARINDAAVNDLTKAISLQPSEEAYLNRGLALARLGRREEAITDFRMVLKLHPGEKTASYALGKLGAAP